MKKIIPGLFFLILAIPFYCQTQQDNLTKYWDYRERLRNKFMVVSENVMEYGTNIPAAEIFYNDTTDRTKNRISWGDANGNMSQYLSVLATELWILKNNGQDYSTTLKELYYAMFALERLDKFSESNIRWVNANNHWYYNSSGIYIKYLAGDINGFSIRDDVTPEFWDNHRSHFDADKCSGHFISTRINGDCIPMEENSQDVIEHNMLGLGLISKLVGSESVENVPYSEIDSYILSYLTNKGIITCDPTIYPKTVNFSLWASDIVKRYINYMQYAGTWNKGLEFSFLSNNIQIDFVSTHWILVNPVSNDTVSQGSGTDFGVAAISPGIIMAGQAITGENLRKPGYGSLVLDDDFKFAFQYPTTSQGFIGGLLIPEFRKDDDLIRTVSCVGNVLGNGTNGTFSVLRDLRDHYNPHKPPHLLGCDTVYEHLPLINLVMFDPEYQVMQIGDNAYTSDKVLYEGLLNTAPPSGPFKGKNIAGVKRDWSSTSCCLWPQHNMDEEKHPDQLKPSDEQTLPNSYIAFNGLDYMMLHNLYYIAFRKEDIRAMKITNSDFTERNNSQRGGTIEINSSILGNNVTYTARKQIKLLPGFRSKTGYSSFRASIAPPRPGNYDGSEYVVMSNPNSSVPALAHKSYTNTDNESKDVHNFDESILDNFRIFPNPCKGKLAISVDNLKESSEYIITNLNGIVVFNDQITTNHQIVNISSLPKGVYFISLVLENKTETKKIILI